MINELHQLSEAIKNADIKTGNWHRKYLEIPNIRENAPCIRIVLEKDHVALIERVSPEKGKNIRKYGSNQGSFPAMNLACLFRICDENRIKELKLIKKNFEKDADITTIKTYCEHNNWESDKFARKYKQCMENVPKELQKLFTGNDYAPLVHLIEAVQPFRDSQKLHDALCQKVFSMIQEKKDVDLALQLLFNDKEGKIGEFGNLSVIIDTFELEDQGLSSAGINFTKGMNNALISLEKTAQDSIVKISTDAFGIPFTPLDDPMPKVKLSAGFDISLRTMFSGQPCQFRYGKIENDTYPISLEKRNDIKSALEWISSLEMKNKTWVSINPDEALFIYPDRITEQLPGLVGIVAPIYDDQTGETDFIAQASVFSEYITKTKESDPENYPEHIQLFIVKKLDKARSKVIYSRLSNPDEIIRQSNKWQQAAQNIPNLLGKRSRIPFPMEVADIMNRIWKQDGSLASDKYKPIKSFHGLELLFGLPRKDLEYDLQSLLVNSQKLAVYAGGYFNTCEQSIDRKKIFNIKSCIVFLGMLLFWLDQRKEEYMNEYPYLLGQLLKVSDNLHELYCFKERDKKLPSQLIGGSMYLSVAEFPRQAIGQLAQRMMPYLNWAKTHQQDRVEISKTNSDGTETTVTGLSAGYLLYQYQQIADKLLPVLSETTRFTDVEKASLFLGYLASFPKSSKKDMENADINE